ncbi:type II toxin-antitoxin system PemK/MazF family toxin [Spirillospora sp. NPDC050679]
MKTPIRRGGVFMVSDEALSMPPNAARHLRTQRPVVVISGDAKNCDADWKHVLVMPISTSGRLATEFCIKVRYGTANLTSKSWIRAVLLQPIAKSDLGDFLGDMPPATMDMLAEGLLAYMGLVD